MPSRERLSKAENEKRDPALCWVVKPQRVFMNRAFEGFKIIIKGSGFIPREYAPAPRQQADSTLKWGIPQHNTPQAAKCRVLPCGMNPPRPLNVISGGEDMPGIICVVPRLGLLGMDREGDGAAAASVSSLEALQPAIESLYKVRDTFFPLDPAEKKDRLEKSSKELISALDSLSLDCKRQPSRRAPWEYYKGKVLDVMPEYSKEAEDHLSKAVKLDPSIVDAWSCLGHCFWKKNDFISAKNCFNLALDKGPNKKILQQLSMLERRLGKGTSNEVELVDESIKHAKEAVALDIRDGQSWYTLGNAYLTSFFVTGAWNRQKLHLSLKAYQNAEKDIMANCNPDLYFNSAIVYQYLEDYDRALRAYEAASARDPALPAKGEIEKIVKLLSKLEDAVINKGWIKPKRLSSFVSSLASESGQFSFKRGAVSSLQEGFNKGVVVYCKVLSVISHDKSVPSFYVVADTEGDCFVVSVYAIRDGMMKEGNSLSLLEPFLHSVRAEWGDKVYSFKTVRIDHCQQLRVNGRTILPQDAACSIIHAQHVPP